MQALMWLRQRMAIRPLQPIWGLAPVGPAWALVGLSRVGTDLARVHTSAILQAPTGPAVSDGAWLSQALAQAGRAQRSRRHRVAMSVDVPDLVRGELPCPADLPREAWPAEIQLEVAQALDLPPSEVSFDFHAETAGAASVVRLRWAGCAKSKVSEYQGWSAGAGWQLVSVEPAMDASQRAAQALVGGLPSLLQQAPQDWQFRLNPMWASVASDDASLYEARESLLLQDALASPVGPRLVAAGLALKAWT